VREEVEAEVPSEVETGTGGVLRPSFKSSQFRLINRLIELKFKSTRRGFPLNSTAVKYTAWVKEYKED